MGHFVQVPFACPCFSSCVVALIGIAGFMVPEALNVLRPWLLEPIWVGVSQLPAGDSLAALATWKASQLAGLFAARPSTRHFMKEEYRHLTQGFSM